MNIYDATAKLEGKTIATDGSGFWSSVKTRVKIERIKVLEDTLNGRKEWLLKVYWAPGSWDVKTMGLIYTDKAFLAGFKRALKAAGWKGKHAVGYTEQGMQGYDHISMIVGEW